MQRPRLAYGLVIGALAGFGLLIGAGSASAQEPTPTPEASPEASPAAADSTTVQGSNSSTDSTAVSSTADASNNATVGAGPAATGGGAQSSQIGDNSVTVDQSAEAQSGDAVAGSQVSGSVGGGTIQQTNTSTGATAVSGDATASNNADVTAGPEATATGTGDANASQVGDNSVRVDQESVAGTGSAVAGSQVAGIVGGDGVVQGTNSSTDAVGISGDADAFNDAFVAAGPFSDTVDGTANAAQVGDNDAVLRQSSEAASGDAVAGSQVTGYVGNGDATIQNQNASTDPVAISGNAFAENFSAVLAGPAAFSVTGTAQSSQVGDNDVLVDQEAVSTSGDAVAGSQVTGLVSAQRGHLTVQNQQSSEDPVAISGNADSVNDVLVIAGPEAFTDGAIAQATQNGDNDVTVVQTAEATSGDAVAGSQITGSVGGSDVTVQGQNVADAPFAFSGDAEAFNDGLVLAGPSAASGADGSASAAQLGDNDALLVQDASATSGDAVAGGTVVGIVDTRDAVVQSGNNTVDATAFSGNATAFNAGLVEAGPVASTSGTGTASAVQNGDNSAGLAQLAEAESGDAVAGGQVFGIVASRDVTVQAQNNADAPFAFSGDALAVNLGDVFAGPSAVTDDGTATATQFGDNDTFVAQEALAVSGDAVAGSQVLGVVGGRDVVAQLTNTSTDALAISGFAEAFNDAIVLAGPEAIASGAGTASANQIGDNSIDLDQIATAHSGDAVAGGQVVGVAGARDATVQHVNNATAPFALTLDAFATNLAAGSVGPVANPGTVSQVGDNSVTAGQATDAITGDAVSGGTVIGIV